MNNAAQAICGALRLAPHPEGGWYRETWRGEALPAGDRAAGTAIHFLLATDERSHWHRVDATEIWCWHSGDPLTLYVTDPDERRYRAVTLGANILAGEVPQAIVPAHHWQAAEPVRGGAGFALVTCMVVPGFDFAGFTLAPKDWSPAGI